MKIMVEVNIDGLWTEVGVVDADERVAAAAKLSLVNVGSDGQLDYRIPGTMMEARLLSAEAMKVTSLEQLEVNIKNSRDAINSFVKTIRES